MKKLHLIINPTAGRGAAARKIALIENYLKEKAIPFNIVLTSMPGEAEFLAANAPENTTIVAGGGDGTISQVINGLQDRSSPMGILSIPSRAILFPSRLILPVWD